MIIGRNPGAEEDKVGKPFVGRAGKLLNELFLKSINKNIDDFYVTNLCKCYTKNNKQPYKVMVEDCYNNILRKEIEIINPKYIIGFGNQVNDFFVKKLNNLYYNINKPLRIFDNISYLPMRHPSYLLRGFANGEKEKFILALRNFLGGKF
jgi:DNA polymerase